MSNKPGVSVKKVSPSSIQGRADIKARQAALEAQRKRNQQVVLFVGAVAALAIVVLVIVLSSRPAEAPVDTAALAKKLDGLAFGSTKEGEYPLVFPALGDPNAPIRMEEISSFACPACKSYHDGVIVNLLDKVRAGQLYYVYMPTTRTGDYDAAGKNLVTQTGYCAWQQGKFWQMHEVLFDWQGTFGAATPDKARLRSGAEKLGMDLGKYDSCMSDRVTQKYIDDSDNYVSTTRKMGSTPSIFLFVRGTQIKPPTQSSSTPDSLNGLGLGELRGIIEANAAAPVATAAATSAATIAATQAATSAATSAPTDAATSAPTAAATAAQ